MKSFPADPILSCEESLAFEKDFFQGDEEHEWQVMTQAGEGVGDALLRDMRELRTIPPRPRILALVGKGHNGGDALIATQRFLRTIPTARAVVLPLAEWDDCRPLTRRAWGELKESAEKRIQVMDPGNNPVTELEQAVEKNEFNVLVDGFLGMQAKLPLRDPLPEILQWINQCDKIAVRVAVDLPTGVTAEGTENPLRSDFTYCTGIVKEPVLDPPNAEWVGRLRYLNLGFFKDADPSGHTSRVLRSDALRALRKLRRADGDKRAHGHLFLLAGSRSLGGAAMMAAQGALKAGVGLITAGIPESLHPAFVAQVPEVMWVPLPETPDGSLALEGLGKIRQYLDRATALVTGPGLGIEKETHCLVREVCNLFDGSTLLDADAIRPEIFSKLKQTANVVITPHTGEYKRLAGDTVPKKWMEENPCTLVLKGGHTQILSSNVDLYCFGGSSLLARGGSGDLLAGILGALLAKGSFPNEESAALAVQWHGRAAEALARQHGQESVRTTEILTYLSFALRNDF